MDGLLGNDDVTGKADGAGAIGGVALMNIRLATPRIRLKPLEGLGTYDPG